jgi:serine O-acetyltransferase
MLDLFRQDVQRWVVPHQQIADGPQVPWSTTFSLLWQHMPLRAMFWFRFGSWCKRQGIPGMRGPIQRFLYRFHGLEISPGADVGGGLYIPHPIGTVIFAKRIGQNCSIMGPVTIGMRNKWEFPIIGDNVTIGAGARVLGGIHVGDGAVIGANAVVINDVPAEAMVGGVPARIIKLKGKETEAFPGRPEDAARSK